MREKGGRFIHMGVIVHVTLLGPAYRNYPPIRAFLLPCRAGTDTRCHMPLPARKFYMCVLRNTRAHCNAASMSLSRSLPRCFRGRPPLMVYGSATTVLYSNIVYRANSAVN